MFQYGLPVGGGPCYRSVCGWGPPLEQPGISDHGLTQHEPVSSLREPPLSSCSARGNTTYCLPCFTTCATQIRFSMIFVHSSSQALADLTSRGETWMEGVSEIKQRPHLCSCSQGHNWPHPLPPPLSILYPFQPQLPSLLVLAIFVKSRMSY